MFTYFIAVVFIIIFLGKYFINRKEENKILPFEKQSVLVVEHYKKENGEWEVKSYRLPVNKE